MALLLTALGSTSLAAQDRLASISGLVRTPAGTPAMGAIVEVLGASTQTVRAFTDDKGFYSIAGLKPGSYSLKFSAPSYLPLLREEVGVTAGLTAVVNVTLNTLFEAIQVAPMRDAGSDDDWKWVLRSVATRPILRFQDPATQTAAQEHHHFSPFSDVSGTLAFMAGSPADGFGSSSDMTTDFSLQKSVSQDAVLSFAGNVGYSTSSPATMLRTSYSRTNAISDSEVALTVRSLPSPAVGLPNSDLQAIALTTSQEMRLGDALRITAGSELQTIEFMGKVTAFRPFGSVEYATAPDTTVAYAYATSEPSTDKEKGFDSATESLNASTPRMSIANNMHASLERAHHQEVSVTHKMGNTKLQLAAYVDRIADPALTGVGEYSSVAGVALPDTYSGTFTYRGKQLNANGGRVVVERRINSKLAATFDYAYGGALELSRGSTSIASLRDATVVQQRHAVTGKVHGSVPGSKTYWTASYRWTNGAVLTPVDLFNDSMGQADPYLNIFIRQPIPGTGFLPNHIEATLDLRNLLAQGYVPVLGQDGQTVFLVQSARSVRGGLQFVF